MNTQGHTKFIVFCVSILSGGCIAAGSWLIYKGYQTGELLIQTAASGVGGLLGVLGIGKMSNQQPDINVTTTPPAVSVTQPEKPQP